MRCKRAIEYFAAKKEDIFKILLENWHLIEEAVAVLEIFHQATKLLQKKDYTLSDFFGHLIVIRENLKEYVNSTSQISDLASCLLNEFDERLPKMADNPMMLCAIFLDRRYSSELSMNHIELAKTSLVKIWNNIRNEHKKASVEVNTNEAVTNKTKSRDHLSVLEKYFQSKGVSMNDPETEQNNFEPNFSASGDEILIKLGEFDKIGRVSPSTSILEYWHKMKQDFPELYLLSTVINAIPPSQSSTERGFSALNYVYTDRRYNLSIELLQDILLLKLNKDITLEIFKRDIEELKQK